MKRSVKPISYQVLAIPIFFVLAFGIPALVFSKISVPVIGVAPTEYYPLDENLYIEGQAPPKIKIELLFESPSFSPVRVSVNSNSDGEWFFSDHLELSSGTWTLRVRTADPPSDWSNPRIIQSRVTGFVFGSIKVRYLPIVLVLLFLIFASCAIFAYAFMRVRKLRSLEKDKAFEEKTALLEKTLREKEKQVFETTINQNFDEIRRRTMDELEHLNEKARDGNQLSREEAEHREKLLHELREAEEDIQKKLKKL